MKLINGKITKEFTLDEVNYLNELITRDEPMPMRSKVYVEGEKPHYYCSACGHFVGIGEAVTAFCDECGQRQNTEVEAL